MDYAVIWRKFCHWKLGGLNPIQGEGGLQEPPFVYYDEYFCFYLLIWAHIPWELMKYVYKCNPMMFLGYGSIWPSFMKHFGTYVPKIRGGALGAPYAYSPISISNSCKRGLYSVKNISSNFCKTYFFLKSRFGPFFGGFLFFSKMWHFGGIFDKFWKSTRK